MTVGDNNRSSNLDELVKVKDEINMEPILVNKSNLSKLRLWIDQTIFYIFISYLFTFNIINN